MSSTDHPVGFDRGVTDYGDTGFSRFLRGAFLASKGLDRDDLDRPVIGIAHTISDYVTCHREMPQLVEAIRRGIHQAGGLAMAFPVMPLAEILVHPTSMLFRNLLAIEAEEAITAQPMDGVVLVGGCDKTVPGQLMAAVSADRPAVQVVAGPMMTGSWRGERLGACTDCRRLWGLHRAGELDADEIDDVKGELCPTGGTCMVMGTASTMACLAEALGVTVAHSATAPAPTGDRLRVGGASGRAAVAVARDEVRPTTVIDRRSLWNAAVVLAALGGSTNAIVHLLAIARRTGVDFTLDDIDRAAADTPVLVDCKPVGSGYLEDLHRAGGMPVLLAAIADRLELDARTIDGTLADRLGTPPSATQTTIRPITDPVAESGGLRVLRGTLAPDGAVIKSAAASAELLTHRGPALVFDSVEDATTRLGDPDLDVTPDTILVLRNAGPVGAGMPEAGSLPIPLKLARAGVRDMVRVSDARMSGTAYGTVVLHVSPEAAVGGPLALVADGDVIELDVAARRLDLLVDEAELARRRATWHPAPRPARGWRRLYVDHVTQAHLGADLDICAR